MDFLDSAYLVRCHVTHRSCLRQRELQPSVAATKSYRDTQNYRRQSLETANRDGQEDGVRNDTLKLSPAFPITGFRADGLLSQSSVFHSLRHHLPVLWGKNVQSIRVLGYY
jgi:hypothetical protein